MPGLAPTLAEHRQGYCPPRVCTTRHSLDGDDEHPRSPTRNPDRSIVLGNLGSIGWVVNPMLLNTHAYISNSSNPAALACFGLCAVAQNSSWRGRTAAVLPQFSEDVSYEHYRTVPRGCRNGSDAEEEVRHITPPGRRRQGRGGGRNAQSAHHLIELGSAYRT